MSSQNFASRMYKKRRQFRPARIPRYLKGSVSKDVWKGDLQDFNNHRYKVFTAITKTDDKPPKFNPFTYLKLRKLGADAERLTQIDKTNKALLKAINIINRTTGRVDTYNPSAYAVHSKWKTYELEMRRIEDDNKNIYELITSAVSNVGGRLLESSVKLKAHMNKFWCGIIEKLQYNCKYPLVILKKAKTDALVAAMPSISGNLDKIAERPLCYLEFSVKGGPFLGRVVVELYHDHVPVTVQNFLAICKGDKLTYKNCRIHRIVPGRYCEMGDITLGTGKGGTSIYGKTFHEEHHVLKHTKTGVLSMVRLKGQRNNSQFCISFTKMETLDKKNVVFGRITTGIDNFRKLEGYGRHIGKPLAEIIISDCGPL